MRKKTLALIEEPKLVGACTVCGKLIIEGEEIIKNNKYICKNCITLLEEEQKIKENFNLIPPDGFLKLIIYIISLINPLIGFLFGAIFFSQKSNENKNFGKKCFILMAAGLVFYLLFFIIFAIINFSITGNLSDFQFNEGYY